MPCRSDYLETTTAEIEASKVLALLEYIENGKLPDYYGNGYYNEVYGKSQSVLREKVPILCEKLKNKSINKFSPEMKEWYEKHLESDKMWDKKIKNIRTFLLVEYGLKEQDIYKDTQTEEIAIKFAEYVLKVLGLKNEDKYGIMNIGK